RKDVPPEVAEIIHGLVRGAGQTLFVTGLSGFFATLQAIAGATDLAVGVPDAGRHRQSLESLIGFFVNLLVLRVDVAGDPTFETLIGRVRDALLDAQTHNDVPFDHLVGELGPDRQKSGRNPFFQVAFQAIEHDPDPELDGLRTEAAEVDLGRAKFDLTIYLIDHGDRLALHAEFAAERFDAGSVERWLDLYLRILAQGGVDPSRRLSGLSALSEQDRRIIAEANAVAVPPPIDRGIERGLYEQFREHVDARPERPAIRHGEDAVTYATLRDRVEARARHLIALGVRPGDLVGLCGIRGIPFFEGMLAIGAAGAGYVPIDTEFPDDRLIFMVEDAALDVIVTTRDLASRFESLPITAYLLDETHDEAPPVPLPSVDGRFPAYVIFTSGSTGRPKGVVTPQHAVTRLLRGSRWFDPSDDEVMSQVASSSFDASTLEIWGALIIGATFAVIDKEQLIAPEHLAAALRDHGVTRSVITTAYFQQFARQEPDAMGPLNAVYFGGERCDPVAIREAAAPSRALGTRLINCYGPTETTVVATVFEVDEIDENAMSVPIGRPIEDTTAHVVDALGREVGVGVPGELWLGGPRLADGYLRRPSLTADRFVPDPFGGPDGQPVAGARCYRTGDLVRWLPDGQLDFLGRIDHQIKLRGYRIELGEIETVLARHPQVADTVVLLRQDPNRDPELVAYATPGEGMRRPLPAFLREYLAEELPDYMVPSAVVVLDTFPITPNGKLDRRGLPAPEREQAAHRPPRTALEKLIARVWCEVLGLDRVGLDDEFFALGGHSLMATKIFARLRSILQLDLPLPLLFDHPVLGDLAAAATAHLLEQPGGEETLELLEELESMTDEERALLEGD
ncbi:MAG: amino acid adenylation domain-containing protein, partial [Acidobacteriota bacterium]